jgi:DNA-binding IclR family transcriptional regulator
MGEPEPNYPIKSVDRALELVLAFRTRASLGVSEAAELLGVSPSTAHRMLSMLQHRGFVQQDPRTKDYLRGPALVEVGLATVRQLDIRREARPHLEALARDTGETAHLMLLQGRSASFLDGVESPQAVRAAQRTGFSLPAHCTAAGKALLAQLPEAEVATLYSRPEHMEALTGRSITTLPRLRRELAAVRERGWAANDGESEQGLRAIAVAIPRWSGSTHHAAITLAGPAFRLEDERLPELAEDLRAAAEAISAACEECLPATAASSA